MKYHAGYTFLKRLLYKDYSLSVQFSRFGTVMPIREIIYGKKRATTYWEITTDPETMPENSTSFVMTNLQGNLKKRLGDLYGLITWVEYGFRQCKQELGWTDYRFTNFQNIERWWEIIFCVYTMISLNSPVFLSLNQSRQLETETQESSDVDFSNHPQ